VCNQGKADVHPTPIQRQVKYQRSIFLKVHQVDHPQAIRRHASRPRTPIASLETGHPWMLTSLYHINLLRLSPHIFPCRLHCNLRRPRVRTDQHLQCLPTILASSHPEITPQLHPRLFKFVASTMPESHSLIPQTKLRLIV
jgi:hypothetical protein